MCKAEGRSHVSMTNGWPVCGSVLICILSTENCTHLRCVNVHRVQTCLVVQFTCILHVQVLLFLFFYCVLILIKLIQRFRIWSIETLMIILSPGQHNQTIFWYQTGIFDDQEIYFQYKVVIKFKLNVSQKASYLVHFNIGWGLFGTSKIIVDVINLYWK